MAPPVARVHKSFRKYVTNISPWEIRDLTTSSGQGNQTKKGCYRFRAVRESIPLNRQAAHGINFSVFVYFEPSHPEYPPDIVFPSQNDTALYEREFESLLSAQWKKNGDQALFLLLEELYEAHKDEQRSLFLSLADKRVHDNVQLALERDGLSLFVSGHPDDQVLWLSMPVDLHGRTVEYILSQLPDKDVRMNTFVLDVCWKVNRQTGTPLDQFLRWPAIFNEFMGVRLKVPQWHQRDDVFQHCEEVATSIGAVVDKFADDMVLRKRFVEALTKELCARRNAMIPQLSTAPLCRPHEHDTMRYGKCSFYFIAGKKEQPLIIFFDFPKFPMELPTIEVQAVHLFDRDGNPLRDELPIYQPQQCTVETLVNNIRGRVQKRVPQILNELEKRHVRAREERAQPEGRQQPQQPEGGAGAKPGNNESEGQPRGSHGDAKAAPSKPQQGSPPAKDQGDAKAKEGAKGGDVKADKSSHNGAKAASNGAESSPNGGGGAGGSTGSVAS